MTGLRHKMKYTIKRILLCKRLSDKKFIEIDLADNQTILLGTRLCKRLFISGILSVLMSVNTKVAGCPLYN